MNIYGREIKLNFVLNFCEVVQQVEGYIAELVLSSCYDFVETCCEFVSKHVSLMQKLRYMWLYYLFHFGRLYVYFVSVVNEGEIEKEV